MQWMTAGRGIVHSEMPEQRDGLMRGFQLWLNLPARDKMCPPHYRDVAAEEIPSVEIAAGVTAKILAGEIAGRHGAIETGATQPILLDIVVEPSAAFDLELAGRARRLPLSYEGEVLVGPADTCCAAPTKLSSAFFRKATGSISKPEAPVRGCCLAPQSPCTSRSPNMGLS